MKVLQTMGRSGGQEAGVFQYRRTRDGITIDASIGQADLDPATVTLSTAEWQAILTAIARADESTFRLTGSPPYARPPNQSLYDLLLAAVPHPVAGWNWNGSLQAYACAILEHERSIDLYHGLLGRDQEPAIITLVRDC